MDSFFSLFDPADSLPRPKKERRKTRKADQQTGPLKHEDQSRRNSIQEDNKIKDEKKKKGSPKRSAHVPEESSFLCEPELSSDVLTKDVSYIDSFIDINYERREIEEKPKEENQEQKKKRSSGRKSRRKKKLSPPKDFIPRQCWNADNLFYPEYATAYFNSRRSSEEKVSWNNSRGNWKPKVNSNLGKNVNDLQSDTGGHRRSSIESDFDYGKKCKRKAEPFNLERQADGDLSLWTRAQPYGGGGAAKAEPFNLERQADGDLSLWTRAQPYGGGGGAADEPHDAFLHDELYARAERSDCELDASSAYSSGEDDLDDSSSNMEEDSGDEVYGSLPPEPQLGNVEYKLKLVSPSDKRFQHLVTQLKWRLRSGGGSAVYVVGVRDCGALRGLRARALRASLGTLSKMAAALRATVRQVTARRVAPHRAVAEVCIRKLADTQQSVELRVAVMGANEAGKSTLIGVLTQGELDNGRGSARLNMFRHLHEVRSGRTSSLSHEILGFDAQGNVVNYGCSELMTAERIGERSAKLVSFLDLAGHSKYQRTTVHGLTGYCPHYVMLVVSATAGINRMTEEHLGLLLALDLPFFIVVTRVDLAPRELRPLLQRVHEILSTAGCSQRPQLISNEQQARSCAAPVQSPILDRLNAGAPPQPDPDLITPDKVEQLVPVFPVSCVSGRGLNALHSYLLALEPPRNPLAAHQPDPEEEACEFQIDEIFRVGEWSGPVVGGLLARGVLREGEHLLIGPLDTGDFVPITINTIYRNRVPCGSVKAGQSASLGLSHRPPNLRQGMVIVAIPNGYKIQRESNETQSKLTVDKNFSLEFSKDEEFSLDEGIVDNNGNTKLDRRKEREDESEWDVKAFKRKDRNILQDIANVESCLAKETKDLEGNLYTGSNSSKDDIAEMRELEESKVRSVVDGEELLLDDPNNPRGCLFFQATVHVLRHTTTICPGFQATVHIGNIRQTAVIEGIMSAYSELRSGESASVVFRFVRQPEYVRAGRKMLFRAGLETRGVGQLTQVFPLPPAAPAAR